MVPKFAVVRFEDEKKHFILPVSDIRMKQKNKYKSVLVPFEPQSEDDFDKKIWYYCKWNCSSDCDECHLHYQWLKAIILCLGESEEDAEVKCKLKRPKFPNMIETDDSSNVEEEQNDASSILNVQKECRRKAKIISNVRLKNKFLSSLLVLNRPKIQDPKMHNTNDKITEVASEPSISVGIQQSNDENSSGNEDHASGHELLGTGGFTTGNPFLDIDDIPVSTIHKRTVNQALNDVSHNEIVNSNKSREDLNMPNNNKFVVRKRRGGATTFLKRKYQRIIQKDDENIELNTRGRHRYQIINGQVYLGLDVLIDEDIWTAVNTAKKPSIFLRDLADLIWTPQTLVNRCLKVNSIIYKAQNPVTDSPRKELETDKKLLLRELYKDFLVKRGKTSLEVSRYVSGINDILRQKIQDLKKIINRVEDVSDDEAAHQLD